MTILPQNVLKASMGPTAYSPAPPIAVRKNATHRLGSVWKDAWMDSGAATAVWVCRVFDRASAILQCSHPTVYPI